MVINYVTSVQFHQLGVLGRDSGDETVEVESQGKKDDGAQTRGDGTAELRVRRHEYTKTICEEDEEEEDRTTQQDEKCICREITTLMRSCRKVINL